MGDNSDKHSIALASVVGPLLPCLYTTLLALILVPGKRETAREFAGGYTRGMAREFLAGLEDVVFGRKLVCPLSYQLNCGV